MRLWFSGPRILRGLVRPGISIGREDGNPRLPSNRRYELRHGLHEAAKATGETITKEDADYCIDKALATGLLDSTGSLNSHLRGTREEIIAGILTTAKAWGQLMTCDQAEHLADRAIRKARWPIGNLITIALIGIFLAVTVLAFMFGGGSGGHSGVRLKKTKGKRNEVTAMIPWWLQYLQTFALIAIPAVGACLAWQQVQIARVKLQHDLYDRRYRVFEATRKLLAETLVHRSTSDEDLRAFVIGTSDAVFLFDDDIARFLKEMQQRAHKMQSLDKMLEVHPDTTPIILVGEKRTQAVDASSEHFLWFTEQFDGLVDKFKPFLKLDKATSG